jgi:hypothetical protein
LVNTFSNDADDLVSERLVPEPYIWDDDEELPSIPTDPLPKGFIPADDGTPKYQAYVPKLADSRFPFIRAEDRVRVEEHNLCEHCRHTKKHVNKIEAKWLKMSYDKAS